MCSWGSFCGGPNGVTCIAGPETLGCAKQGGSCDTCALGFLSSQPPKTKKPHLSKAATLGKLVKGIGWKITRAGAASDLEPGDIITHLNGMALNTDIESAIKVILAFNAYTGAIVVIDVLPVKAFATTHKQFDRDNK